MKMRKMTSLRAVSKKLAMAGLSGTEFLVTSPERILGKLQCSSPGLMLEYPYKKKLMKTNNRPFPSSLAPLFESESKCEND